MKIAHLSDLHLLALEGAVPWRLFNKRITGYLNLRLRRKAVHKPFAVRAAARAIREMEVDHVVITGDLSNLSLEVEFDLIRRFLEEDLGLPGDRVSLVPGNHDVYTRRAHESERFAKMFAPYVTSDLPELAAPGSPFPFVRFRGSAAIVGLSTALPRPPFFASGRLGPSQRDALAALLEHPEVKGRTPVILQHHPIHNPRGRARAVLEGLDDAAEEIEVVSGLSRGLILHGHLHRRVHRTLKTQSGELDVVGTTSASLLDARDERMAGFNVYEIDDAGAIVGLTSQCLEPNGKAFREVRIPVAAA